MEAKPYQYVTLENPFLAEARAYALAHSLDPAHPTGAVVVQGGNIIGRGTNGSKWHQYFGCMRKRLSISTGTHYWLCPGCSPRYHAERQAILHAQSQGHPTQNAQLYLWGHTWCCQSCQHIMQTSGISDVFLQQQ